MIRVIDDGTSTKIIDSLSGADLSKYFCRAELTVDVHKKELVLYAPRGGIDVSVLPENVTVVTRPIVLEDTVLGEEAVHCKQVS